MGRKVDQITVVTDDVFGLLKRLTEMFQIDGWKICAQDQNTKPDLAFEGVCKPFQFLEAVTALKGGIELQIVQPVEGDTVYKRFLKRFGRGIMGLRERIPSDQWEEWKTHFSRENVCLVQNCGEDEMWFDLMDRIGGVVSMIRDDDSDVEIQEIDHKICQICIVTDNVRHTAKEMAALLRLSPWEIGICNNQTVTEAASAGYPAGSFPKMKFLAGIGMYGNLEFEIIEPVEGPLPYFGYLNRRGTGFHHMKEVVPGGWDETLERFHSLGIRTLLEGKIGPCGWCNLDTEELLGFVYELSDGKPMDRLPEGYDPYFYPEEE